MDKKIIVLIVLFFVFFISIIVSDNPPQSNSIITKTPSTEKICNNGICTLTLYSGTMFAQNLSGEWVDSSDVLRITKNSDDLTFHYDGIEGYFNLTFETGVIYNNNYFSMFQVKQSQNINFYFPSRKNTASHKYAVNITDLDKTSLNLSKIQSITLTYKDHYGFTLDQLTSDNGRYFAKNLMQLAFDDLTDSGFTFRINKTEKRIYIENITENIKSGSLYLDPTVTLQTPGTGNLKDSYVYKYNNNTNYGNSVSLYTSPTSGGLEERTYMSWNISSLNNSIYVTHAIICLYVFYGGPTGETHTIGVNEIYDDWKNSSGLGNILNETQINWNNQPCGSSWDNLTFCNITSEDTKTNVENTWTCLNITKMVSKDLQNNRINLSFAINNSFNTGQENGYHSKEYTTDTSLRPYLNVTYTNMLESLAINNPLNNSFLNNNLSINLNFTITNNSFMSLCLFTTDNYITNTTIPNCQNTIFNSSEGNYLLKIWLNDSFNNILENQTNFTIDMTFPIVNNTQVITSSGSQSITFSFNASDINLASCWYAIFNSTSGYEIINTSVNCNSAGNSETVSSFATYNLTVYSNDSAGNENSTTLSFTTSQATLTVAGGGSSVPSQTSAVCLSSDEEIGARTSIERCIIYARIRTICNEKINCYLREEQEVELRDKLKNNGVNIDIPELRLWVNLYNKNQIEAIKQLDSEIKKYSLFTGIIQIEGLGFSVNPSRLDPFPFFIISENPIFRTQVKSNKVLESAFFLNGSSSELSIEKTSNSTVDIILKIDNLDFSSKVFTGTVNYINSEKQSIFQEVQIRVINIRNTQTITTIFGGLIIISLGIRFRKEIINKSKGIFRKVR